MNSESVLSEFLQNFPPNSLHHRKPANAYELWVFWSESEGCENNSSSSADLGTPMMIHDKIKSALFKIEPLYWELTFCQFWAPVKIGGRRLLSTSGQPFSVHGLCNKFAKYRIDSERYKYNIHDDDDDADKLDIQQEEHIIITTGGPATAFLNCRTFINKVKEFSLELADDDDDDDDERFNLSVMVPICFPNSKSICIGVLEFVLEDWDLRLADILNHDIVKEIKKAGLAVFYVQHLIPYKTINALEVTKDKIEQALKFVCASHNIALAQVWIPYEDNNNVPFSYSLEEDSQTKRLLAIKLTGYLYAETGDELRDYFEPYFRFGDVTPREIGEELPLVALQDYESHYVSELPSDMLVDWDDGGYFSPTSALAICLRSNDTGDFDYTFEFIWTERPNYVNILEGILLTLKRCLPGFKFASGAELGNELDVHNKADENKKFKIFQGKVSTVVDYIAPSEVTCKTAPKVLPREVIEKQFGKTMKDAAKHLNVSLSTLKRKLKKHGIREWPGPKSVKRNINHSSIIQINTNKEDNGAIEDTSTVNQNKNVLTIKAEYAGDIFKLHLPISQANFVTVEKEIGRKLKLSIGTFKLKYIDEDEEWISLTSDEDMNDCIKSSKKSDQILVRMKADICTTNIIRS